MDSRQLKEKMAKLGMLKMIDLREFPKKSKSSLGTDQKQLITLSNFGARSVLIVTISNQCAHTIAQFVIDA